MTIPAGHSEAGFGIDPRIAPFFRMATAIAQCLDLPQALEMACQSAVELLKVDHSGLVRFDRTSTEGVVVAEFGHGIVTLGMKIPLQPRREQALVLDGAPIVVADVETATDLGSVRQIFIDLGIRSILIVPIVSSTNRVLGSFGLDSLKRRAYSEEDIAVCQELARLMAVAIERAELLGRLPVDDRVRDELRQAVRDVGSPRTRAEVLVEIVNHAERLIRAENSRLYLFSPREQQLQIAAIHRDRDESVGKTVALRNGNVGMLLANGEPYAMTADYRSDPRALIDAPDAPCGALLEVPLALDHGPVGTLCVESRTGRIHTEREIKLLQWFADYAAIELRNVDLADRERRNSELRLEATGAISEAPNLTVGLTRLAALVMRSVPSSFCRILLADDDGLHLTQAAAVGVERAHPLRWVDGHAKPVSIDAWPGFRSLLDAGEPHLLRWTNVRNRAALERYTVELGLDKPVQSLALIPLRIGARMIGVVDVVEVRNEDRGVSLAPAMEVARAIGDQVTVLIERMRQHEAAERRTQLVNQLEQYSGHIGNERDPEKLLHEYLRFSTVLFPGTIGALFENRRSAEYLDFVEMFPPAKGVSGVRIPFTDEIVGRVARTGGSVVESPKQWTFASGLFGGRRIRRLAALPLKVASDVEYVLILADPAGQWLKPEPDLGILERFTARAASALATARLIQPTPRLTEQLALLQPIGDYMQRAGDLDTLLSVFLTGITASYGLRFNRAAVFLADGEFLTGRKAIGDGTHWKDHVDPLNGFSNFVRDLELGTLETSQFACEVGNIRLPLRGKHAFSKAIIDKSYFRITPNRFGELPDEYLRLFAPTSEVLVVPLLSDYRPFGVLVADNSFSGAAIADHEVLTLLSFCRRGALAIHNRLALDRAVAVRERSSRLYEASTRLLISEDPRDVAQNFVNQLVEAAGATSARAVFIDERGVVKDRLIAGTAQPVDSAGLPATKFAMGVMKDRRAATIEDVRLKPDLVNPQFLSVDDRALICLPLVIRERAIGVIWLGYREVKVFSQEEQDALQLYAQSAAIAYGSAQTLQFAQQLHDLAAQAGPDHSSPRAAAMDAIVTLAREVFNASCATLWPYDFGSGKFLPQEFAASGLPQLQFNVFRDLEPGEKKTTYTALEHEYIEVNDGADLSYGFLTNEMRERLFAAGIVSFQASVLKVDGEPLGVLYVSYLHPRRFDLGDRTRLETFAKSASQLLKRARLIEQISKVRKAAHAVTQIAARGQITPTLDSIAQLTKDVVNCDAVVLFEFNPTTHRISHPFTMVGVNHPHWDTMGTAFPPDSWLWNKLAAAEDEELAERVDQNPEYRDSRFAKVEGIKTFLMLRLRAAGRTVGLMFANFRHYHRLTSSELDDLRLFAGQAAMAIRNAQLLRERQELATLSHTLLGSGTVKQIAQVAAAEAARMFGDVVGDVVGHVVLKNDRGNLYIAGSTGASEWIDEEVLRDMLTSQTNYTLEGGQTAQGVNQVVVVHDYATEQRFLVHPDAHTCGYQCSMSARLHHDGEPIGVILVQPRKRRTFGPDEMQLLQQIADTTTVAMQGVRRFEREADLRTAMREAMQAITGSNRGLEQTLLTKILEQAAKLIDCPTLSCTAHLLLEGENEQRALSLEAVYPEPEYNVLYDRIGERRTLDAHPVGIIGRVVMTGETQLVNDVSHDLDYVAVRPSTRAELAVPMFDYNLNKLVGVINVESEQLDAFTAEHVLALESLAEMAVIVVQNGREYRILDQMNQLMHETRTRLESRSTLAWIGMMTDHWRHDIENAAHAIRNDLVNLELQLTDIAIPNVAEFAKRKFERMRENLAIIQQKKITPPVSSEEGRETIRINEMLRERAHQLWDKAEFQHVELIPRFEAPDNAAVFVSREWLRSAFDFLVENAANELLHVPDDRRELTLLTRLAPGGVEIVVADRGRGIPSDVLDQLFRQPIARKDRDRGLGVGLLMAQAIIETYGGKLKAPETGPEGTTMVMWFPLSRE
jgi:GAF domain-containing protein